MRIRRLIAIGAAGAMAATGVALVASSPASAGTTNWPVDGQVKAKGDPFYSGIEIFGNAEPGQVRSVFALPGETALFRVRVQNTRFQNNRIAVEIDDSGGGLIRILDGKTDVTEAVFTDSYVRKVGPRESFVLKVKVRPEGGSAGVEFHLQSRKWMSEADHVIVDARSQPPS